MYDSGDPYLTSTVDISITITDVNDNKPMFEGAPYFVSLENFQPSQQVFAVFAEDEDEGFSGSVVYDLKPNSIGDIPFYIQTEGMKTIIVLVLL